MLVIITQNSERLFSSMAITALLFNIVLIIMAAVPPSGKNRHKKSNTNTRLKHCEGIAYH